MPRYTVHVRGEWLAVPCQNSTNTVRWLGKEAVRRYMKNKPDNGGFDSVEEVKFYVRRCKGLGLLDHDDTLEVALEDNEFVEVVIEGDVMSPDFIPSQPEGVYLYSKYREPEQYIYLDGNSLTTKDLVNLGKGLYKIKLTPEAEAKVRASREVIESIVNERRVVYGITTGFGKFARTVIPNSKLQELQVNLVRSHSAGVGKPLIPERSRMLLALRINVLAKGYSGISLETLHQVIEAFNASCLPYIPEQGTVGASGDLAPLSHLALGLIGEGKMWSPKSGWADAKYVLQAHGLKPITLKPKEGLALINGTQMITSLGCEAVERASAIARQADIVAALTLEVLKGTTRAFDTDIHALRPHRGQIEVAFRFRSLLDSDHHPSEIAESHRFCDRVQDAYTLRCCPQVLDTKDLTIHNVLVDRQEAQFALGQRHSFKGAPLEITLPFELGKGQDVIIEISFETSPRSSALQWFTPEQTSGKRHPFLFSQCQATHCRAVLPCQDTPSVKLTYYAEISVPNELVALMSAKRDGDLPDPEDSTRKIYRFIQNVPIPCYLIALVVGALESREIGPRTLVWAEKELVDKSAYEFAEAEAMLKTAEDLAGPYVWGQYDLLVLPPSFPYGGMENPCLTFVTPTLLAGDRSLSNVIAHEISHSWTGNLVTNKTWEHFWLNEGHTVYLERRIGGRLFGEQFRHFQALGGWRELQNTINTLGSTNPVTNLIPSLKEVDPDVAYSSVPYEKGFALLLYLEQLLGGPDVFIGFLRRYIQQFAYKSITTEDWKNFLYSYFKDKVDLLNKVDWNAWMNTPGMPPVKPTYDMTLSDACVSLSQRWIKATESDLSSFSSADIKELSSHQLIEFLALLLLENPLPVSHLRRMQEVYDFNAVNNSEIRFRWLRLCVQATWEDAIPLALKMATEQGRMKFTRPLFK